MPLQNMKQTSSNSEKKHKSHKQLQFIIIIICITICIIVLISVFIVAKQGVVQGTVTITLISIVSGVVISLLSLLISLMQWHTSKSDHAENKPKKELIRSNDTNSNPIVNPAVNLELRSSNLLNSQIVQPDLLPTNILPNEVEVHAIEIPHLESFYGRENESSKIYQWIDKHRCKVIAIVGMGGIGKTSLAVNIVEHVKNTFDVVYWESLRDAPALTTILKKYILFLSEQRYINFVDNIDSLI